MSKKIILITDRIEDPTIESDIFGPEYEIYPLKGKLDGEHIEFLSKASGMLVWHSEIDEKVLRLLNSCQGIVRYGTGFDNIDTEFARDLKIPVCNTPDYGIDEVADSACGLILNAVRQLKYSENILKFGEGTWGFASPLGLPKTSHHMLGIVGCGRIGTAVALRMKSFGMKIGFFDPYVSRGYEKAIGVYRFESLAELVTASSIISIHTPLTPETKGIVNEEFIQQLNPNTILINTARGALVSNLNVLVDGLLSKQILFLGMDVAPEESGDLSHQLFQMWNSKKFAGRISITPHSAYFSDGAYTEMRVKASLNLKGILEGKEPLNLVNT